MRPLIQAERLIAASHVFYAALPATRIQMKHENTRRRRKPRKKGPKGAPGGAQKSGPDRALAAADSFRHPRSTGQHCLCCRFSGLETLIWCHLRGLVLSRIHILTKNFDINCLRIVMKGGGGPNNPKFSLKYFKRSFPKTRSVHTEEIENFIEIFSLLRRNVDEKSFLYDDF